MAACNAKGPGRGLGRLAEAGAERDRVGAEKAGSGVATASYRGRLQGWAGRTLTRRRVDRRRRRALTNQSRAETHVGLARLRGGHAEIVPG